MTRYSNCYMFRICLLFFFMLYSVASHSVVEYAFNLHGSVRASGAVVQVSVTLLDADGILLDVTNPKSDGSFIIDLSVLDNPVYEEVEKLYLQLERGTNKKKVRLINYIKKMSKTVELRPVSFP